MASEGINENDNPAIIEGPEEAMVVDLKPADDGLEGSFIWKLNDFSKIKNRMHYSEPFNVAGFSWRVLMFSKGNNTSHLSLYLDVANSSELPYNWSRYAHFKLVIKSQFDEKYDVGKDANHHFNARESDWGFTQFMLLNDLHDQHKGFIVNDQVNIHAFVTVKKLDNTSHTYDSKKETGFVGLKNQGATCYMNSLLQTLFHIPYFRKAVYHMPTTEEDVASTNIPLALQSLFYKVQFHDQSVATKDLTRSFGWDANDSFMQHDVQELNRVLCDKLEEKMKSTTVEGTIQQLFEGHIVNYIECMNVEYKSTRKEPFLDLQLDVKGCKDIYDSFDKYVEIEELAGDNKYRAEGHGLQDAKKGVLFQDFPPVLELQLKRFEYDFQRDSMVKINERYEFPQTLDLDIGNHKYLNADADKSVRNLYELHSVLVHSGGVHGGHYYAFVRPTLEGQWYKFDDERVTKETEAKAVDDQFGGEDENPNPGLNNPPTFKYTKSSNAYMLVYIRKEDTDRIMCPVTTDDIALHLQERFKREQEEKERKKKDKSEAHLFTVLKVARDADFKLQIGTETYFDLVEHDKVKTFRVRRETPFGKFKEQLAEELGIPVQCQRYWQWAKRQNHTYRPNRPILPAEDSLTVLQVKEQASTHAKNTGMDLKLYLEEYYGPDNIPRPLPLINKGDILLFFKVYDPATSTLSYVGKMFANMNARMMDLTEDINRMAGFPAQEELLLFEEIKFEPNVMCETIDRRTTLSRCQLEDGDIICFQKNTSAEDQTAFRHKSVPDFLEYIRHRQVVHFRRLDKPKDDDITLELSKQHTYEEVTAKLAAQLELSDPALLRLTAHNGYSQQPRPQPFKHFSVERLHDMLVHCHQQMSDILYYEILDIPLPELERLKILKVAFHNHKTEQVEEQQVRLPKESCVEDVLTTFREMRGGDLVAEGRELRMLEVCYSRIYKVFQPNEKIDAINDQYWTLRVEEVPLEERDMAPSDRLINMYHFSRDTSHNAVVHNFGEPFFLRVAETETLGEVKIRIRAKLEIAEEEFAKWKFAFVALGRPEYLADSDTITDRFAISKREWGGQWENYLGLEHEDKEKRRPASNHNTRYNFEKPVKIHG